MEVRETGYQIHDYLDWNPSKDDILSKREKRAEAGRKGGIQGQATLQEKRYRDKQTSKQLLDPLLDGLLRTCPSHVDDMDQVKANPIPIPICSPTENNLVSGGPPPKPKRERKHRYPESTVPYSDASDGDIKAWCLKWGIPFEHAEFAHFLGHHRRKESHYRDWLASWDTWLKTGEKFAKERGSGVRIVQQEPANGPLWKVPEAI